MFESYCMDAQTCIYLHMKQTNYGWELDSRAQME